MKRILTLILFLTTTIVSWADDSGTCGESLTWTYVESTQTLTISGTGEMYNYSYSSDNKAPWNYNYCSSIIKVVIESGVTSIGDYAFYYCTSLTSIEIPNSVTSIGEKVFVGCSGLTSINIPNRLTSIGNGAFEVCTGLTKITIPNSVASIEGGAFYGCIGLSSITIPNSVTSIGYVAFSGCKNLKTVTIGSGVNSIGISAFNYCNNITDIFSLNEEPFEIDGKDSEYPIFPLDVFNNATLYVPVGTIDKYKATEGWKDFLYIKETTEGGDIPEIQKCATPTIAFKDGKLMFDCETEDVEFVYSFSFASDNQQVGNNVILPSTYTVTVYAKKDGYLNSETITQEIQLRGVKGDVNDDGKVDVADINAVISIMKKGEAGYFYIGTTQPTAENYKTLSGIASYTSIEEAVDATATLVASETLYMLCPTAWMTEKKVLIEDQSGNTFSFSTDIDVETISGYSIYKVLIGNNAVQLTITVTEETRKPVEFGVGTSYETAVWTTVGPLKDNLLVEGITNNDGDYFFIKYDKKDTVNNLWIYMALTSQIPLDSPIEDGEYKYRRTSTRSAASRSPETFMINRTY